MQRMKENKFSYYSEHLAIDGGHLEPLNHFDKIDRFLDLHFKSDQKNGCSRI
jgi:hypothetical protein